MKTVVKAAEQRCIELGQKKRSKKFTFELFKQYMNEHRDEWENTLWPYKEAEYIATCLTEEKERYVMYKEHSDAEAKVALHIYYFAMKVKFGSDKKPTYQVVPVIKIGNWDYYIDGVQYYYPTLDAFGDGSVHLFSCKVRKTYDIRKFDYDKSYERFCLLKLLEEIKRINPDTKYTDKNIFIE